MGSLLRFALLSPSMLALCGCLSFFNVSSDDGVAPAERQLPASTQALLAVKGMKQEAPIFIRIFKEESELEVWKWKDGRFRPFKTYAICAWSGGLGPKIRQGDYQAPEGFYTVGRSQMNPHSNYHLAFNIGFPNAYDAANGHTGSALMVHGNCKSAGCYAMTDAYIEEIYILARDAFAAGQTRFHVHAYPFRMTAENMERHRDNPSYPFWLKLKEGYDSFEATGKPPVVKVCAKQYMVNVKFRGGDPSPEAACPAYTKLDPAEVPTVDGVPQTLIASLDRPEAAGVPPVMVAAASAQPAPATEGQVSSGPATAMAAVQPKAAVWSQRVKPPVIEGDERSAKMPPMSQAQPVNYAPGAAVAAPNGVAAPSEDPSAVQKLNRSGKGGKLSVGTDQPSDPIQAKAGQ
jgi:murein L,D-transpeptidase YafK